MVMNVYYNKIVIRIKIIEKMFKENGNDKMLLYFV